MGIVDDGDDVVDGGCVGIVNSDVARSGGVDRLVGVRESVTVTWQGCEAGRGAGWAEQGRA